MRHRFIRLCHELFVLFNPLPLPLSGEGAFFVLPGFRAGAKKAAAARFSYVNKM